LAKECEGEIMLNAKQVADIVTLLRGLLGFGLVWLGLTEGSEGLNKAVFIMILAWTGDAIDGKIARRSRENYQTWIGVHDLEIDMAVSCGLLVYLITAGFVSAWTASIYVLLWALILWMWKQVRVLGMLCQAPIYGYFVVVSLVVMPDVGVWILVWFVIGIIITWPQFPNMVVPGFLDGMREFLINYRDFGEGK
jgi:phosphatidylglycerophosphate synthase